MKTCFSPKKLSDLHINIQTQASKDEFDDNDNGE